MIQTRTGLALRHGARRGRPKCRGFTLIEVLSSAVVVGTCVAAIVSAWAFAFTVSKNADQKSVAYSIGRRALEETKETGFEDSTEGTTTYYFDGSGANKSTTQSSIHSYSAAVTVSTDIISGGVPAGNALRTVTVTVTSLSTNTVVYQTSTYLARAGI